MPPKLNKFDEPYGATIQDIHNSANDLRKLIDDRVTRSELEKHYATKAQVLMWGIIAVVSLVGGYFYMERFNDYKLEKNLNKINSEIHNKSQS